MSDFGTRFAEAGFFGGLRDKAGDSVTVLDVSANSSETCTAVVDELIGFVNPTTERNFSIAVADLTFTLTELDRITVPAEGTQVWQIIKIKTQADGTYLAQAKATVATR